ncbi:unnamed protein product [Polarella glacialis]|uniref:Uncharacterized protein n=1 Tax=Polarella glacialis TaxID=89957 RepID=A0A813L3W9_POLGL|nr:unnamed protein product [Polarella glacialis]
MAMLKERKVDISSLFQDSKKTRVAPKKAAQAAKCWSRALCEGAHFTLCVEAMMLQGQGAAGAWADHDVADREGWRSDSEPSRIPGYRMEVVPSDFQKIFRIGKAVQNDLSFRKHLHKP